MRASDDLWKTRVLLALHIGVLVAAAALVLLISWDALNSMSFLADPVFERVQTWICYFFLADIVLEWSLSREKLRYVWSNLFFIVVSIPYYALVGHLHWHLPEPVMFVLRFMPLARAAFVIGMLAGAVSRNRMSTLFATYMTILIASLYFGSLMFFIEEQPVNEGVKSFWDAAWWAIMDMTTCGSSISEMTPTGQVLGVVLAAEGLVLFPVFTVYITSALTKGGPTGAKVSS